MSGCNNSHQECHLHVQHTYQVLFQWIVEQHLKYIWFEIQKRNMHCVVQCLVIACNKILDASSFFAIWMYQIYPIR